jgi:ankyrin repeat protein
MKNIIILSLFLLVMLSGLFFTRSDAEQDYLYRKHINKQTYSEIAEARVKNSNIVYYRHILSKKEELKNNGGIQNQLQSAINNTNPRFIELLCNKYGADINELVTSNHSIINKLLIKNRVLSFEKVISLLNKDKIKSILEKVLLDEMERLLTTKGNTPTFFDEEGATLKLLSNYQASKHSPLLITLLNHASGLAKDKLVKDILDYGVKPTATDKNGMAPLQAFFLLTPQNTNKELPEISQLMQEIRNTPNQEKGITKAAILIDFYSRSSQAYLTGNTPYSVSQQDFIKAHKEEKSNILKYLITKGAKPNDYKILGNTPFELLTIFGASDIFLPLMKYVKKTDFHELALLAIENMDAPLFLVITNNHKINYKWKNKERENLLMVLLKYDIIRKHQIDSVLEITQLYRGSQVSNAYGAGDSDLMAMTSNYRQKADNRKEASKVIQSVLKDQRTIAKALLEAGLNPNATTKKGYSVADYLFPNQITVTTSRMISGDYKYLKDALKDSNLMLDLLIDYGLSKKIKLKYDTYSPVNTFFGNMLSSGRDIGSISSFLKKR